MQNAEHSKLRFEARQERLQRLEEEKIAARKARQAKAAAKQKAKADAENANKAENDKAEKNPGETATKAAKEAAIAEALARVKKKKAENKTATKEGLAVNSDAKSTTANTNLSGETSKE